MFLQVLGLIFLDILTESTRRSEPYVAGTVIIMAVAAICELRAPVISGQPTSINGTAVDNGSAQTKELALAASTVYRCIAMGSFNWAITAIAGNGAVSAGGTPNAV
mgnify:CR=1 FL=1